MHHMRLALTIDIALMSMLGSCAARSRAQFSDGDERVVQRGGCIESRRRSTEPEHVETEAHGETGDDACVVDLSHIDIRGHTDDQRLATARQLYEQGDTARQRGDVRLALQKFEEGYAYAHERHVFNFNIGLVALHLQCCKRAKAAFLRFLELVPEHRARAYAIEKLAWIDVKGCAYP